MTKQSATRHARREARKHSVPIVKQFVDERCTLSERFKERVQVSRVVVYAAYLIWCEERRHLPISPEDFHAVVGDVHLLSDYLSAANERARAYGLVP